jgi:hypothetical protein
MNWPLLTPLLITTAVAIGGWFAVHLLSSRRDAMNQRRERRTAYLIEAYRRLETSSYKKLNSTNSSDVEIAIADILLFGTARQIELARTFADEFSSKKVGKLGQLLRELRRDLRKELRLEENVGDIVHLRVMD